MSGRKRGSWDGRKGDDRAWHKEAFTEHLRAGECSIKYESRPLILDFLYRPDYILDQLELKNNLQERTCEICFRLGVGASEMDDLRMEQDIKHNCFFPLCLLSL